MVPRIFDRKNLVRKRSRARKCIKTPRYPDYLFDRIADDLELRLSGIERQFSNCLYAGYLSPVILKMLLAHDRIDQVICSEASGAIIPEHIREMNSNLVICDEEAFCFADGSFDLCVAPLGLQFVNDLPGSLIQIQKMLKPDGLFLGVMAGGQTLSEMRQVLLMCESETFGGASARISPFMEVQEAGGLLQRAGFTLPVTDTDYFTINFASLFDLVKELRCLGATAPLYDKPDKLPGRKFWMQVAAQYQQMFPAGEGSRIRTSCELIYLTGWCAHESQQQALKPGTASQSMETAVNSLKQLVPNQKSSKGKT